MIHRIQTILQHQLRMLNISLSIFWPFEIVLLKILFSSVPHFSIGLFKNLMSNILSSLYILNISPMSDLGLVKILSHLVVAFLSYWLCPLLYKSFSVIGGSVYLLLLSVSVLLGLYLGSGLLCPRIEDYFPLSLLSGSVWLDLYWGL